jgi:hypothetical protein
MYVFFILVFFLNGYFLEPSLSSSITTSKDKDGSLLMKGTSNSVLSADLPLLSASLTKEVSYFSFLVNRSATFYSLIDFKANWVSSPITHSSVRNRYSVIFYKGFYDLLNTKSTRFSSNFNYFSQIKAIILDFLSTYSGMANSLNKTFSEIKGSQSFYSFSTKSVKSIYDSSFVPKMNIFVFEAMYETFLGMVKEIIGKDKRSVSFFSNHFFSFLIYFNFKFSRFSALWYNSYGLFNDNFSFIAFCYHRFYYSRFQRAGY